MQKPAMTQHKVCRYHCQNSIDFQPKLSRSHPAMLLVHPPIAFFALRNHLSPTPNLDVPLIYVPAKKESTPRETTPSSPQPAAHLPSQSMSSIQLLRLASRTHCSPLLRPSQSSTRRLPALLGPPAAFVLCSNFHSTAQRAADKDAAAPSPGDHHEESFEEFTARYGSSLKRLGQEKRTRDVILLPGRVASP